jgi:TusA-related sulfurtransferase
MNQTPIQKWLHVNRNLPEFDKALQSLLGHACVDILRRNFPNKPVFSLEKAFSLFFLFYQEELNVPMLDWMSNPLQYASSIVDFCEKASTVSLQKKLPEMDFLNEKLDLRGVVCPGNAVRAKLVLAGLPAGSLFQIALDEGYPIQNVPQTLVAEGYFIKNREKKDDYWIITVLKEEEPK